jgi:DNA transposition AAA+ family ATPase
METKKYSEELRQKLETYREKGRERPLTMSALGTELGVSATRVNKYLTGKPEGDVEELERLIADMLKSAATRTNSDVVPFETNTTQILCATFEAIRKTNDIGLVTGPAGIGKTVAVRMYVDLHPTTLSISVPRWQRHDSGVASLLFAACETRDWNHQIPKSVYLVNRLRNSNRLVILDNAQRLTPGAREWLFDLYDETGCPIAMIGNPEVLQHIRQCDQHFSRIGIYQAVTLHPKKIADYSKKLVDALVEKPAQGLYELAASVAEERGHLRALKKQLLLMLDLAGTATYSGDQIRAFHAAHKRLVRDYDL